MIKKVLRTNEFIIALAIILVSVIITSINPNYFTVGNFYDFMRFITVDGILALGVLIVLISGGVDVSGPAIANFSAYVLVTLLIKFGYQGPMFMIYILAIPFGLVLGLVNGFFVSKFRIPTLIVTLGTSSLFYGAMLFFLGSQVLFNLPKSMIDFSKQSLSTVQAVNGGTTALHPSIILLLIASVVVWLILRYTTVGRGIYAIGGNRDVAERTGFNINFIQYVVYGLAGMLAAVAGVTHGALYRNVSPSSLLGSELDYIAAVVLGGAAIAGGRGTVIGTLLGVLLINILRNSLVLVGIPSDWQRLVIGIVLVIGTGVPAIRARRARRNLAPVVE